MAHNACAASAWPEPGRAARQEAVSAASSIVVSGCSAR